MFCPNCGKDCADSKFCSECGHALFPVDGIDATDTSLVMGKYDGVDGHIELSYYTVTICKKILSDTVEHVMFYHDLAYVEFHQATDTENGYLAIREKTEHLPSIETELDAECDEKTLVFGKVMNNEFQKIYACLKSVLNAAVEKVLDAENPNSVTTEVASNKTGAFCPKCNSKKVYVYPGGPHRQITRPRGDTLMLALTRCVVYLYYAWQKKQKRYICLNCKYQWTKW